MVSVWYDRLWAMDPVAEKMGSLPVDCGAAETIVEAELVMAGIADTAGARLADAAGARVADAAGEGLREVKASNPPTRTTAATAATATPTRRPLTRGRRDLEPDSARWALIGLDGMPSRSRIASARTWTGSSSGGVHASIHWLRETNNSSADDGRTGSTRRTTTVLPFETALSTSLATKTEAFALAESTSTIAEADSMASIV
jgi:hypothetical protein